LAVSTKASPRQWQKEFNPFFHKVLGLTKLALLKVVVFLTNAFLAIETMDWAVESSQPMIMLLLDFEKAYDMVEWDFFEGTMVALGFSPTWIAWTRALYMDSWCYVGINGLNGGSFKLSRSIRQGCPLAPFLYLFVANCLGYVLEKDKGVEGILLPGKGNFVIDQEFADDTNLYLADNLTNLNNLKAALNLFTLASGAKINWHKSRAIWVSLDPLAFEWGREENLIWLQPRELTRYLGHMIGFQVTPK
jgi:hypothetical protein